MVFKLVRTDVADPCKVRLPVGTHILGRGTFLESLECDDKRVSRKHGKLDVTEDTVTLTSLHHNPCFFIKKEMIKSEVLQLTSVDLSNGDKFGLLPDSYWYELLHCVQDPADADTATSYKVNNNNNNDCDVTLDEEEMMIQLAELAEGFDDQSNSPSLLRQHVENEETSNIPALPTREDSNTLEYDAVVPKRRHSPVRVKEEGESSSKVKIKQEDVADEDINPGTSNDLNQASSSKNTHPNVPASPVKPPNSNRALRERCMYGANCYRKNPIHKTDFSHPSDPDWGDGPTAPCPWGSHCAKIDPRHWRDHHHPPGINPPQNRPNSRVVHRHGNIIYINNARVVNFYDDHFNVEELSDGDSVDYDYEF